MTGVQTCALPIFTLKDGTERVYESYSVEAYNRLAAERDRLRKFLTDERERHMAYRRGSSHWSDCHKVHRECARVRDIDAALAAGGQT